jgi:Holliday junction DNA helicase RuvA
VISHLRGRLAEKTPTQAIIDVGGVGLAVEIPLTVGQQLPNPGGDVHLYTWLQVREDDLRLYGFQTREERSAFLTLMGIRGVGGRLALNILSHLSVEDLSRAAGTGDLQPLLAVPGVGRKTAQRLLLELGTLFSRDSKIPGREGLMWPWPHGDARRDAAEALVQLGYLPAKAREAVEGASSGGSSNIDDLIRAVLSRSGS